MRIECVRRRFDEIPDLSLREIVRQGFGTDTEATGLTVGKRYTVFAREHRNGNAWFYIADDDFGGPRSYPVAYAGSFFDVVDSKGSSFWKTVTVDGAVVRDSFSEWATDPVFYERLIDGESFETQLFEKYRVEMELEFPSDDSAGDAELLDESWLLCPKCSEAWESQSSFALVECVKCRAKLSNPRYSVG